jgi:hypothetical protein
MQVELYCPCCSMRFAAPPDASSTEVLDRMVNDGYGSWYFLGDGDTFEDMIFATLTAQGDITCPRCDKPVQVSEESLGQLAMDMLAQW